MNRLKECRENARLSQKYVALTLGVKPPSVSNWERGETNPTPENMVKLADIYGVSVDYLLGRTDNPTSETMDEIAEALYPPAVTQKLKRLTAGLMSMPGTELDRIDKMLTAAYPEFFHESSDDDEA